MGTKLNDLNDASADVRDQLLPAALCPQGLRLGARQCDNVRDNKGQRIQRRT